MKTIYECIFDSSINDEIDYLSKESKELIYCKVIDIIKIKVTEALKQASEKAFVEYIDLNTYEIFDYTDVIT